MDDTTKIAFGKYFGKELKDIPAAHWKWLMKQEWFVKCTYSYEMELKEYIKNGQK
jgi:uncharacterized protein (DUF3820 family)